MHCQPCSTSDYKSIVINPLCVAWVWLHAGIILDRHSHAKVKEITLRRRMMQQWFAGTHCSTTSAHVKHLIVLNPGYNRSKDVLYSRWLIPFIMSQTCMILEDVQEIFGHGSTYRKSCHVEDVTFPEIPPVLLKCVQWLIKGKPSQSQQGLPPVEFVEILVQHLEKRCLILQVGPVILLYSILAYEDCDHGLIRQQDSASFIGRNPFEAWTIELGHQDESHHVADLKELLNSKQLDSTCAKRLEPNGYGYVYVYIDVVIQTLQIYIADANIAEWWKHQQVYP